MSQEYPPGKKEWPELVLVDYAAAALIIERQNPKVKAQRIIAGSGRIKNFDCSRVWVDDNINNRVVEIPKIVINQLNRNGEKLTDARVVEKVLRLLTDNFENGVCVIEESKNFVKLTVDEFAGSVEAHEQRKNKKKEKTREQTLQTKVSIQDEDAEKGHTSQANWRGRGRGPRRGGRSN